MIRKTVKTFKRISWDTAAKAKLFSGLMLLLLLPALALAQTTVSPRSAQTPSQMRTAFSNIALSKRYVELGKEYLQNQRYDEAITQLEAAITFAPNRAEPYAYLADAYIQEGNIPQAQNTLALARETTLDNDPERYLLLYYQGYIDFLAEDYLAAKEDFSAALAINPDFKEAASKLALTQEKLSATKKKVKAKTAIKESKAQSRVASVPEKKKAQAKQIKKIDDALKLYEKKSQEMNSIQQANRYFEEGSTAFGRGDLEKAIQLFNESISLNPKRAETHFRLSSIYIAQKDFEKAIICLKKAIDCDPKFTKAYINLGSAYATTQNYALAISAFEKALKLDNQNPNIYYNMGMIYTMQGKSPEAEKFLAEAKRLAQETDNPKLLDKIEKATIK